ncbi:MAG: transglutaminase family protein [Acidobacteria bacterium]|nr:transglutaminase family protein [Acidobacteriota bacterium]MBW4044521.1 transglutaminase family protein [Acidobacteriota bacterium]
MLIRLGYDIRFYMAARTAFVAMLHVHPSRTDDLLEPDHMRIESGGTTILPDSYLDSFGNRCSRFVALPGELKLTSSTLIEDSGAPDPISPWAVELPVEQVPNEVLRYLMNSRYCEVDSMVHIATDLFGGLAPGWQRVQAINNWVHQHVTFGYHHARATKTALNVYTERTGVCRDFQHLAVTFCRALNIPARYATGYLGDIGVPPSYTPMDFSAWYEVYLSGRWWTMDARHNAPRIGRVLMAVGRDASDVAITTSFGQSDLTKFEVISDELPGAVATQ